MTQQTRITLSGLNGYILTRTVFADDVEIGRVECTTYNDGVTKPTWSAFALDGSNHGDMYISDWAAAKQLALGLGLFAEVK